MKTHFRDTNADLKMRLAFVKSDPLWILKIELKQSEEKLQAMKESERLRQLNLKIRWLRLEIHKVSSNARAT